MYRRGHDPALHNKEIRLLLAEGLAVGALIHGGIYLVGADQDAVQGAEVCVLAVVGALSYSTLNALVCMAIHRLDLLLI